MTDSPSILGQCADCCSPCAFIASWPTTIYITFASVVPCACFEEAIGSFKITDISAFNSKIALTGSVEYLGDGWHGTWTGTVSVPGQQFPFGSDCSIGGIDITMHYGITVSISPDFEDCQLAISADTTDGYGGAAFSGFKLLLTLANVFDAVSNASCTSAINAGGGTGTLSLT